MTRDEKWLRTHCDNCGKELRKEEEEVGLCRFCYKQYLDDKFPEHPDKH